MKLLIKFILYSLLFLTIMFGLGLLVLSAFRGNSDTMKEQVENIGGLVLGQEIQVGRLHHAQFYPQFQLDAESVVVMPAPQKNPPLPGYFVEKIDFSIPFWSIYWGRPVFQKLDVRDVIPKNGANWRLDHLTFRQAANEQGEELFATGQINETPFDIHVGMTLRENGYTLRENPPLRFVFDNYPLSGVLRRYPGGVEFDPLSLGPEDREITGEIRFEDERWTIQLDLGGAQMNADLLIDHTGAKPHVTGYLSFPELTLGQELEKPLSPLIDTLKKLRSAGMEGGEPPSLSDLDVASMDLQLSVDKLKDGARELGAFQTNVVYQDHQLRLNEISGELFQGTLSGAGILKTQEPSTVTLNGELKLDQAEALQFIRYLNNPPQLSGKVDIFLKLEAEAQNAEEIWPSLTGEIIIRQNGEVVEKISLTSSGLIENFVHERPK